MDTQQKFLLPRFIIFEGVDGTGKTALFTSLVKYYQTFAKGAPVYADAMPGTIYATLGEWVYRLHHKKIDGLSPDNISPLALQLLHVASHVDTLLTRVIPVFRINGYVILDRFWWSTYAYSREFADQELVRSVISTELMIMKQIPSPVIIYLTRSSSLKPNEVDIFMHQRLEAHYREIIQIEREGGAKVHELNNDGSLKQGWEALLRVLELPYYEM